LDALVQFLFSVWLITKFPDLTIVVLMFLTLKKSDIRMLCIVVNERIEENWNVPKKFF